MRWKRDLTPFERTERCGSGGAAEVSAVPEIRKDPVTDTWVIISTERGKRPSDFGSVRETRKSAECFFCGGHESETPPEIYAVRRDSSPPNTPGWEVRVVPNKFAALTIEGDLGRRPRGMYDIMNGVGAHEVIIESPRHTEEPEEYSHERMCLVLQTYRQRIDDLRHDPRFRYVQVFKNHGPAAGASLEHEHSQLIALPVTPRWVREELEQARKHYDDKERCLFCDILSQETKDAERVVHENDGAVAFCPFASRFPLETWILPKRHQHDFTQATDEEYAQFADALLAVMRKLTITIADPPYNWVLHTASILRPKVGYWGTIADDFHWHLELIPRLTKVAGFEWGTGFYINPTPPEAAAGYLREATPPDNGDVAK